MLSERNTVLTFYYDDQRKVRNGYDIGPFRWKGEPWGGHSRKIKKVLFDDTFAACTTITSTAFWFDQFEKLTTIIGLKLLDTSNVTDMRSMFCYCTSLPSLDVSGFDTSNVTDMSDMFLGCEDIESLDLRGFKTGNVTDMRGMFGRCSSLESLDLSGFDTSNVTDMSDMFLGCEDIESLDLRGFKTDNVTDMRGMFGRCTSLESINVSGFDTSNVTICSIIVRI